MLPFFRAGRHLSLPCYASALLTQFLTRSGLTHPWLPARPSGGPVVLGLPEQAFQKNTVYGSYYDYGFFPVFFYLRVIYGILSYSYTVVVLRLP